MDAAASVGSGAQRVSYRFVSEVVIYLHDDRKVSLPQRARGGGRGRGSKEFPHGTIGHDEMLLSQASHVNVRLSTCLTEGRGEKAIWAIVQDIQWKQWQ